MRKVWVLVANSTVAKIYKCEDGKTLVEHHDFYHEQGHLKGRDIYTDGHGRVTKSNYFGSDSYENKVPVKVKEAEEFAREICKFLEEGYQSKKFEHLYLISKSPFLSHIRHFISGNVERTIQSEIQKDITQEKPEQIREYLPPVL